MHNKPLQRNSYIAKFAYKPLCSALLRIKINVIRAPSPSPIQTLLSALESH